jgi:hypothetical protein
MALSSLRGSHRRVLDGGLRRFFGALPAAILTGLLAGCVTPPEGIRTVDGGEQNDVPVPRTFELEKSYTPAVAAENNFRSWHGYYRGNGTLMAIAAWYVAEMPKQGWIYKGMQGTQHRKELHFSKADERAVIELYEELDPKEGKYVSIVHAEVHPMGPEELGFEENMLALTSLREGEGSRAMPASASVQREAAAPVEAVDRGEKMEGPAARPAATGTGKASRDALEEEIRRFEEGE